MLLDFSIELPPCCVSETIVCNSMVALGGEVYTAGGAGLVGRRAAAPALCVQISQC